MFFPSKRSAEELAPHYFEVRLTPEHREALIKLLEGGEVAEPTLAVVLQKLKAADRYDCLPFKVNWSHYEEEAAKRGSSMVDYIWDKRAA